MSTPEIAAPADLWNKVQSTRFVLLTTSAADGSLSCRPMTIQRIEEPGTVLFFASVSSPLVQGLKVRPNVNIGVADPDDDFYVSIEGRAVISNDRALIKELWSPLVKAWFPGGVDDEDLVLIEVVGSHAQYWNVHEGEMTQFFKMAKAAVTGSPPTDLGEHGTIELGRQAGAGIIR
ncbi:MAG: pyridoxamine 5'-phosphate oxidase family protein [Casimicrobiaceae bacterium]